MDSSKSRDWLYNLGPGIIAATAFGITDVLSKVVFAAGTDVLTLALFRGFVGLAIMFVYLRLGPPPLPQTSSTRWIQLGLGVLFAGIIFGIFKALELVPVSIAILTYFAYPLLTGIAGAIFGIDKLTWRGAAAALAALFGLVLMIRAHPQDIAIAGIAFGLFAAFCRVAVLLIARAKLNDADARLTTWNSLVSSTIIFSIAALVTMNWHNPQTTIGWAAIITVSICTAIATLTIFMSTTRIGPFRTALIMNLEPLLATILSAPLLGEVITPIQALGGAIMLAALVAFQLRR
jgi:drug/metabolite transporter (DMT)-like permease